MLSQSLYTHVQRSHNDSRTLWEGYNAQLLEDFECLALIPYFAYQSLRVIIRTTERVSFVDRMGH